MTKTGKRLGVCALGLSISAFALPSAADEPVTSPYATGGEVTRIDRGNLRATYIHVFTNTDEAATFASTGKRDLKVRYLVVGAGGAGGNRCTGSTYGGGGGGGGGVCEKDNVQFPNGSVWQVLVGKGATSYSVTAGASSISNGVNDIETVPGGGNGGNGANKGDDGQAATDGAAGGGYIRIGSDYKSGAGTYASSLFGVANGPFAGAPKGSATRAGGGGGGAGAAGSVSTGGEGLPSDITGVSLVYGSGGGGGTGNNGSTFYNGDVGGTRGGNGGVRTIVDNGDGTKTTNFVAATSAAANSGGGGGGALGTAKDGKNGAGNGADGIVVIRYDVTEAPCEGGDVITKTLKHGTTYTYIHTFTNTDEAAEIVNVSGRDIKNVRFLVVGGGGAGGGRYASSGWAGGGGGGGGVCERKFDLLAVDTAWTICVGKGATSYGETAGASSISNGVNNVETVPGGGNGGSSTSAATDGAGGGGYTRSSSGYFSGAGTYASSLFCVTNGPFAGAPEPTATRAGGGGGGAGAAGKVSKGGEGLTSDITGEALVYGSGGGGGGAKGNGTTVYNGGVGGTRAGNGGLYVDDEWVAATPAEPNSGCGGGGAIGHTVTGKNDPTGGADGIVVIRYDYNENPPQGLMLIFR